jgi:mono/diheme cytochrome c family protein
MWMRVAILNLLGSAAVAFGQAAATTNVPPLPPTTIPAVRVVSPHSANVRTVPATNATVRVISPHHANVRTVQATNAAAPGGTQTVIPAAYRPLPKGVLAWDRETQKATVKFGTVQTSLAFSVTNVSSEPVRITSVRTSCGCTIPKLPPMPWTLEPQTNGTIGLTMKLAGKRGKVIKTMTVTTDKGFKTLYVHTTIEEPPPGVMGQSDRMRNLQIASANRQAVFQGDCVPCHVTPALNKMGAELYDTACGICHEAEHRASMVPDLAKLQKETNADYWRTWITTSMDGKLMPAFALEHGGFLSAMQIDSLVKYLVEDFPEKRTASATPAAAAH